MSEQEAEQTTIDQDSIADDAADVDATHTALAGEQPSQSDPYDFEEPQGISLADESEADGADDHSGSDDAGSDAGEAVDDDSHGGQPEALQDIPADLLAEAESLGFSKEEVAAFGGAQQLSIALTAFNRQLSARGRQPGNAQEQQVEVPETKPEPQPKVKPTTLELPDVDWDEVDPKLGAHIQAQAGIIQELREQVQGFTSLREQVQAHNAHFEKQNADAAERQFNGFLENLGDAWADVFGSKAGAKAAEAKQGLIQEAYALAVGYQAQGKELPDTDTLLQRALRSLHGDRFHNLARQELNGKLAKRSRQGIARPSNREATELDPTKQAVKEVAAKMRDMGLDSGGGIPDEL